MPSDMSKFNRKECVFLEVDTWSGLSIGATHYYGRLKTKSNDRVDVERVLSVEEAARLTKDELPDAPAYEEGFESIRFYSEEDVVVAAKNSWKKHFPDYIVLLEGSSSCLDPMRIIDVQPAGLDYEELNRICQEWVDNGYWGGEDQEKAEALSSLWEDELNVLLGRNVKSTSGAKRMIRMKDDKKP